MKMLLATVALAVLVASPAAGQTKQKRAKSYEPPRHAVGFGHARGSALRTKQPCAAYSWSGCLGWDPDPRIRMMIQMDSKQEDL